MQTKYIVENIENPNEGLMNLVREFRKELNRLNNITNENNLAVELIKDEINSYFQPQRKVFGLFSNGNMIGFLVLKCEDKVFWLDWMYVLESERGLGGASELFDCAESYVNGTGESQLYVWVHPHNKRMLRFLEKKEYNMLNLIEVTKGKNSPDFCSSDKKVNILGSELQYR